MQCLEQSQSASEEGELCNEEELRRENRDPRCQVNLDIPNSL